MEEGYELEDLMPSPLLCLYNDHPLIDRFTISPLPILED